MKARLTRGLREDEAGEPVVVDIHQGKVTPAQSPISPGHEQGERT